MKQIQIILCGVLAVLLGACHYYTRCEEEALKSEPPYMIGYYIIDGKKVGHIHSVHELHTLKDGFVETGAIYTKESAIIIIDRGLEGALLNP